jgi:hypothetical protein
MATTLATIRLRAQQRSDTVNDGFVSTAEWTNLINSGIRKLHNILCGLDNIFFTTYTTFSTASGTQQYALPTDFKHLIGVDVKFDNVNWSTVKRADQVNRNKYSEQSGLWRNFFSRDFYYIVGDYIGFIPVPDSACSVRLTYVQTPTALASDTDSLSGILEQWVDYVTLYAAKCALNKSEQYANHIEKELAELEKEIREVCSSRTDDSFSISDTRRSYYGP